MSDSDTSRTSTFVSEKAEIEGLAQKALKIAVVPVAAFTGYRFASESAHNAAYDQAKRLGAFDDIMKDVPDPAKEGEVIKGTSTRARADIQARIRQEISKEEFQKRALAVKGEFQDRGHTRMVEMGLDNFKAKWKYMAKADKQTVIRAGLAGAGVAVGALLSLANTKAIAHLFSGHAKKHDQQR